MTTPDKCPYCGAAVKSQTQMFRVFVCNLTQRADDDGKWMQSDLRPQICYERQIERLTAERDELEREVERLNDTLFSLSP